ncbi:MULTISPECIES: 30S ribosomal protein S18 [unclassified Mycoplasma]|uniref:30S ribosomal protein S18 n=1 Tax=unclassified Mycoplasma TaxID=2683645 RepID=UPI000FDE1ED5
MTIRKTKPRSKAKGGKRRRKNQYIGREVKYVDYKNVELLSKFINIHGRILPARVTGVTALQQRAISNAIKRARYMALLPYSNERIKR